MGFGWSDDFALPPAAHTHCKVFKIGQNGFKSMPASYSNVPLKREKTHPAVIIRPLVMVLQRTVRNERISACVLFSQLLNFHLYQVIMTLFLKSTLLSPKHRWTVINCYFCNAFFFLFFFLPYLIFCSISVKIL